MSMSADSPSSPDSFSTSSSCTRGRNSAWHSSSVSPVPSSGGVSSTCGVRMPQCETAKAFLNLMDLQAVQARVTGRPSSGKLYAQELITPCLNLLGPCCLWQRHRPP